MGEIVNYTSVKSKVLLKRVSKNKKKKTKTDILSATFTSIMYLIATWCLCMTIIGLCLLIRHKEVTFKTVAIGGIKGVIYIFAIIGLFIVFGVVFDEKGEK